MTYSYTSFLTKEVTGESGIRTNFESKESCRLNIVIIGNCCIKELELLIYGGDYVF